MKFPPTSLPEQWGSLEHSFTLIEVMDQLLKSSRLSWMVQSKFSICSLPVENGRMLINIVCCCLLFVLAHCALLEISSSAFLSCGIFNMKKVNKAWALENESLIQFADHFLVHNVKLLCLFVHIIEERDPELREKVMYIYIYIYIYMCVC